MNVKKYLMIVCCVLGVCLAAISGVIVASRFISNLPGGDNENTLDLPKASKGRANILVMGLDNGGTHTDTIMLFSLDNVNKKINVLSIPRDTRVVYQGQYDKINHLFSYKGKEENTIKAVTQITGVPIHYYAVVDFKGFRNIIDMLGGVDFEVPAVNKDKNGRAGMFYSDPVQNLKINLVAGMQRLNGAEAEGLVRFRSGYPEADLGRIRMQQEFIKALIKQKLQIKYLGKALDIYKEVLENTRTNYGLADAASHLSVLKAVSSDNVETFSLPGYGADAHTRYGNASCFLYNATETEAIIKQHFSAPSVENSGN